MKVDLSGDEIGLIQESLFVKIANLKQFERHCENQQEILEQNEVQNKMNFDVKDVKSWANRHDVKVGDKGYFFNKISNLHDLKENEYSKIESINDNQANCFFSTAFYGGYSFFLPIDAVKKDKPKNKYRPFEDLYEFYQFISFNSRITKEDFTSNMLLGLYFTCREKKAPRFAHTIVISRIDFDLADDPCKPNIVGRNLGLWFDYSEIMNNKGEWVPFGVEVKD